MKNKIKLVIAFVLGAIIFGSIGVYASAYVANQITYTPANSAFSVTTVAGAIDNLYEYAQMSASNAERMMKPSTWPVNEEIDFGDGVYGQRFTGTCSAGTLAISNEFSQNIRIKQFGGDLLYINGDSSPIAFNYPPGSTSFDVGVQYLDASKKINLQLGASYNSNYTYDVWVLYTK